MIQQPDAENYRKQHQSDAREAAEEDAEGKVKDASDDHISSHHEVVAARHRRHEINDSAHDHHYSEEKTESEIALRRMTEHDDAHYEGQYSGQQQKPPVFNGLRCPSYDFIHWIFHSPLF